MQHSSSENSDRGTRRAAILLLVGATFLPGCNPTEPAAAPAAKPRAGVTLRVSCPDARLADIIDRCLQKDREDRYESAAAMLEALLQDEDYVVKHPGALYYLARSEFANAEPRSAVSGDSAGRNAHSS